MIQSIFSSSSALAAYSKAQNLTAHNIANVNTTAYNPVSSTFSELANFGGVQLNPIRAAEGTGYMIFTGNSLDLAIDGRGYFAITNTDGSMSFSRRGDFSLDGQGNLVTKQGGVVAENVAQNGLIEIDSEGRVFSDGAYTGRIDVVDSSGNPMPDDSYRIEQGRLEASDVDIAREMVDSMTNSHAYKANIVTTQTVNTMLGTIIDMMA